MSRPMVIYHDRCSDGWCAAWILERCLGGAELVPAQYGDDPPLIDGRTVYVVDFSYPRDVMIQMDQYAHKLTVLDHHTTAADECVGLPFCTFDATESGASLALRWCESTGLLYGVDRTMQRGMSSLAAYVKDRDLWQWRQDNSEEINAAIRSWPFDLEVWDTLAKRVALTPQSLTTEGAAILRYREQLIEQHVAKATDGEIGGHTVPIVECTATEIVSDVAGRLAKGRPFAACWWRLQGGDFVFSLRGREGCDVSRVAKRLGGGGHPNAAGFRLSADAAIGSGLQDRWDISAPMEATLNESG